MEQKTEAQSIFDMGFSRKLDLMFIEKVPHALIPEGAKVVDFEHLSAAPLRIKAHPQFSDIESFKAYIEDFKDEGSRIFIDENEHRFFTIFDCHAKGRPAWGDHSASYCAKYSREWERFKAMDGKKMDNLEFAEFIEDNVAYITKPVKGIDLLAMAQSIKVRLKGEIEVTESLSSGIKKLLIQDEGIARGVDSRNKEIRFPEEITLSIRIYHNDLSYEVPAFLRYRKAEKGLVFWIKIPDPKAAEEQAFDNIIDRVKLATKLPTLKGSYQGPSHKR